MRTLCAWCTTELAPADSGDSHRVSHGVCLPCCRRFDLFPTEAIPNLSRVDVDRLPFGVIVLDDQGLVRQYNAAESQLSGQRAGAVIGKPFFDQVAPCANVQQFAGRVATLRAGGRDGRITFDFLFAFDDGEMLVGIVCLFDAASGQTTILVEKQAA